MARPKKGFVLKLPAALAQSVNKASIGYGLHLIATGARPTEPVPTGDWRSVRIVLSERAQILWDTALPKYPSRAALAREALAVVKELGPAAQTVTHI